MVSYLCSDCGHGKPVAVDMAINTARELLRESNGGLSEAQRELVQAGVRAGEKARGGKARMPYAKMTREERAGVAGAARHRMTLVAGLTATLRAARKRGTAYQSARVLLEGKRAGPIKLDAPEPEQDDVRRVLAGLGELAAVDTVLLTLVEDEAARAATVAGAIQRGGGMKAPPAKGAKKPPPGKGRGGAKAPAGPKGRGDAQAKDPEFERQHPRGRGGVWIEKGEGTQEAPSARVQQLQKRLNQLGYGVGAPDGRFADRTEAGVAQFQSDYGLEATGKVDEATRLTMVNPPPKKLADIQAENKAAGVTGARAGEETGGGRGGGGTKGGGKATGGTKGEGAESGGTVAGVEGLDVTDEASIREFQRKHGLKVDGLIGPQTRKAIAGERAKADKGKAEASSRERASKRLADTAGGKSEDEGEGSGGDEAEGEDKGLGNLPDLGRGEGMEGKPSDEVKQMQDALDDLGFDLGRAGVDGRFGPQTERAVREFQRANGLKPDGKLGPDTRRVLEKAAKLAKGAAASKDVMGLPEPPKSGRKAEEARSDETSLGTVAPLVAPGEESLARGDGGGLGNASPLVAPGETSVARTIAEGVVVEMDRKRKSRDELEEIRVLGRGGATVKWDPSEHPRGRMGQFVEVLNKLRQGDRAKLTGGISVTRTDRGFRVKGFAKEQEVTDASSAAGHAMDKWMAKSWKVGGLGRSRNLDLSRLGTGENPAARPGYVGPRKPRGERNVKSRKGPSDPFMAALGGRQFKGGGKPTAKGSGREPSYKPASGGEMPEDPFMAGLWARHRRKQRRRPVETLGRMGMPQKPLLQMADTIADGVARRLEEREFSGKQREKAAEKGQALPHGGFPIKNAGDLRNAIQAIGRAKNRAATIAHIKKRARALGLTHLLPKGWRQAEEARASGSAVGNAASLADPGNEILEGESKGDKPGIAGPGDMKRCPSCNWRNKAGATRCSKCKADLRKKGDAKAKAVDEGLFRKRGSGSRKALKRLPDGTFAPVGQGAVLHAGDKVDVPHRDKPGKHVRGTVVGSKSAGKGDRAVRLDEGPDKGTEIDARSLSPKDEAERERDWEGWVAKRHGETREQFRGRMAKQGLDTSPEGQARERREHREKLKRDAERRKRKLREDARGDAASLGIGVHLVAPGTEILEDAWGGKPGPNWAQVGPHARKKLGPLIRHYMKKPHPFTSCVRDNTKRFGRERAQRVCAVLKDLGHGGTGWRKGGKRKKKVTEAEMVEVVLMELVEAGMRVEDVPLIEGWLVQQDPELEEARSDGSSLDPKIAHTMVAPGERSLQVHEHTLKLVAEGVPRDRARRIAEGRVNPSEARTGAPSLGAAEALAGPGEDSLEEGTVLWDPAKHPRGRMGKFIDVLGQLKRGQTARLKGTGVEVHRPVLGRGFDVRSRVASAHRVATPEGAAGEALSAHRRMRGGAPSERLPAMPRGHWQPQTRNLANDPFERNRRKIARDTMKMSDMGARVMGGMSKDEARKVLGIKDGGRAERSVGGDIAAGLKRMEWDDPAEKARLFGKDALSGDERRRLGVKEPSVDLSPEVWRTKPLNELARVIEQDWRNVNFAARPYLDAMRSLESIEQPYGADSGDTIVAYFLSNATSWRGPTAKAVKAELKRRLKAPRASHLRNAPSGLPELGGGASPLPEGVQRLDPGMPDDPGLVSEHAVDYLLRTTPQQPGEPEFAYHARVCDRLPPRVKHEVLFRIRERYEPVDFVADGAARYRRERGLPEPQVNIREVHAPLDKTNRVARAFESMGDQAGDPRVRAAYEDFKRQNEAMFEFITRPVGEGGLGITIEFGRPDREAYASAREQAEDVRVNRHFTVQTGLGGPHGGTMTPEEYDRFRAVHDIFGHVGVGGGFDRHGEYEAWLSHMSMYTPPGRDAMASEYHGVNTALWTGEPGTPGTGKSVLLPPELIQSPYDEQGRLIREAKLVSGRGQASREAQVRSAAPHRLVESEGDGVDYLIRRLGLTTEFAIRYERGPLHPKPWSQLAEAVAQRVGAAQRGDLGHRLGSGRTARREPT